MKSTYELADYLSEIYTGQRYGLLTVLNESAHTEASFSDSLLWEDNNTQPKPSWGDIKEGYLIRVALEAPLREVLGVRVKAYPSLTDQADMQYWDSVNGTTTWADAITAVKEAHPKP